MKRDAHKQHEELQRNIAEQEQAMAALLTRVMERPLDPLHKRIDELKMQLGAVQQANAKGAQAVEAGLSEAIEGQGKRLKGHFGELADGLDGLKEELGSLASTLGKHNTGQADRDERMQQSLLRADVMLAQLDAKADATVTAAAATVHGLTRVDEGLGAVRVQQKAVADQLSHELSERIDTLQPGLAPYFESLAVAIDGSAREAARQYGSLSETQKAVVAATVQEQLALQLAPFQQRTKWLFAVSALSFASTLALLVLQLR